MTLIRTRGQQNMTRANKEDMHACMHLIPDARTRTAEPKKSLLPTTLGGKRVIPVVGQYFHRRR
jgi:hypothetical protein